MNFKTSTHRQRWLLSKEQLRDKRAKRYDKSIQDVLRYKKGECDPVSLEEEKQLCLYYERMISKICSLFHFPHKILAISLIYFKRFYLAYSILDFEPRNVMLTCIYLACKVENAYISAEELAKGVQQDAKIVEKSVLGCEMGLLQGLDFDLVVHTPYAPFDGFCFDLESYVQEDLMWDSEKAESFMQDIKNKGYEPIVALLYSDAPLIYTPGLLAFAALEVALKSCSEKELLQNYTRSLLSRSSVGGASLQGELEAIHKLGMEGSRSIVDESTLKGIDRKLKGCRNPIYDPSSEQYRKAHAEQKQKHQARQKLKISLKRAQMESEIVELTSGAVLNAQQSQDEQDSKRRKSKGEEGDRIVLQ